MGMHQPSFVSQESFWICAAAYYDATYIPKLSWETHCTPATAAPPILLIQADPSASCDVSIHLVACTTKSAIWGLEYASDMMLTLIGRIEKQFTVHKGVGGGPWSSFQLEFIFVFPHRPLQWDCMVDRSKADYPWV